MFKRIIKGVFKSEQQENRIQSPGLSLYVINDYFRRFSNREFRIYVLNVKITNVGDSSNSIITVSLEINLLRGDLASNLIIDHDSRVPKLNLEPNLPIIQIPAFLNPYESVTVCTLFRVDEELLSDANIETYFLQVVDSHGIETRIQRIFINEVIDEKRMA